VNQVNQPEIQWLKMFGRWLAKTAPKPPKPLMFYETRAGDILDAKLSLLPDSDKRFPRRPGAVSTWNLVNRQAPNTGLFITLDNLIRLDKETNQAEIKRGLQRSQGLTHRFQVSWVVKGGSNRFHFVVVEAIDIDLSNQYVDEAPAEIVRLTAREAFDMRPVPGLAWQDRIYNFPWLGTIEHFSPKKGCPEHPRHRRLCMRIQRVTFS
jgi:hypothetical protein